MGLIIPNMNSGYNKFGGGYFRDINGNINKIGGMNYSDGKGNVTKIYSDSLPIGTIMYKPSIPLYLAYGETAFASDGTVSVDEIKTDNIIQLEQPLSKVKNGITVNFSNKYLNYYNVGNNNTASTQFAYDNFYTQTPSVNISKNDLSNNNIILMNPQHYVRDHSGFNYYNLIATYNSNSNQLSLVKNATTYSAIVENDSDATADIMFAQIVSIVSY